MAYKGEPTATTLKKEMTANKTFGMPTKTAPKKMSPKMVAQRKKSRISNAASKVMGGLYSK